MSSLILAALLTASTPIIPPDIDKSSIRQLVCDEGTGSAFVVKRGQIATAAHVALLTNCKDSETAVSYVTTHSDETLDFALMEGDTGEAASMPYSCSGYIKGVTYISFGITNYDADRSFFTISTLVAQDIEDIIVYDKGRFLMVENMRRMDGYIIPGVSGGPVTNSAGVALGMNNTGQLDMFGIPVPKGASRELKDTILCAS